MGYADHHRGILNSQHIAGDRHADQRHGPSGGERLAGLGGDVDPIQALFMLSFLVGVIMCAKTLQRDPLCITGSDERLHLCHGAIDHLGAV